MLDESFFPNLSKLEAKQLLETPLIATNDKFSFQTKLHFAVVLASKYWQDQVGILKPKSYI